MFTPLSKYFGVCQNKNPRERSILFQTIKTYPIELDWSRRTWGLYIQKTTYFAHPGHIPPTSPAQRGGGLTDGSIIHCSQTGSMQSKSKDDISVGSVWKPLIWKENLVNNYKLLFCVETEYENWRFHKYRVIHENPSLGYIEEKLDISPWNFIFFMSDELLVKTTKSFPFHRKR